MGFTPLNRIFVNIRKHCTKVESWSWTLIYLIFFISQEILRVVPVNRKVKWDFLINRERKSLENVKIDLLGFIFLFFFTFLRETRGRDLRSPLHEIWSLKSRYGTLSFWIYIGSFISFRSIKFTFLADSSLVRVS